MKVVFVLFFSLFSVAASAQLEKLYKRKPWLDKKYDIKPDPRKVIVPLQQQQEQEEPGVKKLPLKGKYVGTNSKGDEIYAMQPDNMPCLVPSKSFYSNMPVTKQKKDFRLNKESPTDSLGVK